ncbi:hypothetical protein CC86DRAFT_94830 [Ophiobolus disseminans]|uniref:Uncharacterized protein n=1 Tax=Ophiobolus disseminans TaxID=1469910 RepID=A0A6A6ZM96_9PLEO|nr:hypothetical protein CC86DRAFT_94830 [Ophiobolus disseminans]
MACLAHVGGYAGSITLGLRRWMWMQGVLRRLGCDGVVWCGSGVGTGRDEDLRESMERLDVFWKSLQSTEVDLQQAPSNTDIGGVTPPPPNPSRIFPSKRLNGSFPNLATLIIFQLIPKLVIKAQSTRWPSWLWRMTQVKAYSLSRVHMEKSAWVRVPLLSRVLFALFECPF